jgi:GT2 family glycosyltransferase
VFFKFESRSDSSMNSNARATTIGASIVLYRTRVHELEKLIGDLLEQGAARVYLVDNSPLSFPTFEGWTAPDAVTVIRDGQNVGYGSGHNLAIRESVQRHDYHLVSNPDIHLGPNVLSGLKAVLDSRPDVGLVMPKVVGPDGEQHHLCKRAPSPVDFVPSVLTPTEWRKRRRAYYEMRDHSYDREFEVECLSGCFMFFRSRVLVETGGFDDRFFMYLEDFDLCRRSRRIARNLYYPGVRVVHEHRRGHRTSWRLRWAFARSALTYFGKWGWFETAASRQGKQAGPQA